MPATEQTWRESKLMHVVFGISSLAMLVTTIWMLAADHRREWKDYQRKFQDIETWTAQARINQQESAAYETDLKEARDAWEAARRAVPQRRMIEQLRATRCATTPRPATRGSRTLSRSKTITRCWTGPRKTRSRRCATG